MSAVMTSSVEARGSCSIALSGGSSPAETFRRLASRDLPWSSVHVFQVDERAVAEGHPDRNLGLVEQELCARISGARPSVHVMPVSAPDLDEGARSYADLLEDVCGSPPVLDVLHLGIGPDGHVASLFPDDPVQDVGDRWVATTREHGGYRRMTLTFPVLLAAREAILVVQSESKAEAVSRMVEGDPSIPAGRLASREMLVLADPDAAARLSDVRPRRRDGERGP